MRIAIVNDMPLAVEALRRALAFEPKHQLVWVAGDGEEAVRLCAEDTPDLILMDLIMPVMDGVEATRRIMAQSPCAIVIVTVDRQQNVHRVFEAMGFGALDVVDTPALGAGDAKEAAAPLLRKIMNIGWLMGQQPPKRVHPVENPPRKSLEQRRLVAIGSSAGGPAALETLLKGLPRSFQAAIVLVQHVDQVFAAGMAEWLSSSCGVNVRLARDGETPQAGTVLLAGTNHHIRLLKNGTLAYTAEPVNEIYRPSIDVFFESVARYWDGEAVGVLLTGMGRDGAQGLKLMRQQGFLTIAQDQHSSSVYGMPKAAAAIDAAVEIRPLDTIAPRLLEIFHT
ncbi:two-component system, chemotaxis family, response regulator WspF [Pseudomonas lundensis]|jgi:two-component system response regulator WspF|uniref:chemotaxis response regulator protein-glutamate methylesterase n=1 Tax=Pseudomonas TaxID=286 RepID=UPI000641C733|nr:MULTISPECIES: chemotaxis response regulator protein-glutamate methylesterase [Pseudomonas]AOZ13909.1 chemotaxis-specific protein-glutamate methylesterase CheB [Pseudomonas lundensis]MBM1182493.1 chemotaxis response regulator protein-glutamate methylesterase [Pseudomonas lundensis]NMY74269.1 chemotaxis response regulator protein-glutamate methylesterase [Pseudomonas sp. WS 5071]NNA25434.1 chemotaxis response regulator protein-glutamate methylesterase [Pseudomonas lundensis]QVQ78847.1 chemota